MTQVPDDTESGTEQREQRSDVTNPHSQQNAPGHGSQQNVPGHGSQQNVPGHGNQQNVPGHGNQQNVPGHGNQWNTFRHRGTQHRDIWTGKAFFVTLLSGLAGAGLGLFWIVFDAMELELAQADGVTAPSQQAEIMTSLFIVTMLLIPVLLLLTFAPFFGASVMSRVGSNERLAYRQVGIDCFAGSITLLVVFSFLFSTIFDAPISFNFGDIFITASLAGLVAAGAGVGGVWLAANQ